MRGNILERLPAVLFIGGIGFFLLAFLVMGFSPWVLLKKIPMQSVEEISRQVIPEFEDLARQYPEEFKKAFGTPSPSSFQEALELGKSIYIAEACWHCHSQYIRPVSNEDIRFGPVSKPDEYMNAMNLPQLFGTRRVGPDLIREAERHSNDWHVAHFFNPRLVVPTSVMPSFPWFFDGERPNRRGLAIVTYVQWLGSWLERGEEQ